MADEGEVLINGTKWLIIHDDLLPRGRRGITREERDAQPSDPGRIRTASWDLSGAIGLSREGPFGELGVDYVDGALDTRFPELVTSGPQRVAVSLASADPVASNDKFAGFKFGGAKFAGSAVPDTLAFFDEDRGGLFAHRGRISTRIDPNAAWVVLDAKTHDAPVTGAETWGGKGYLGQGANIAMQRRATVTVGSVTYEDVTISAADIHVNAVKKSADRLWMVSAEAGAENELRFSLDGLVTISPSFVVGDFGVPATGIGILDIFTFAGSEVGLFSFLDTGKPKSLISALRGHRSPINGSQQADIWGWNYTISDLTLYAVRPGTANPVGIGSDKMLGFEGYSAKPTAIFAWREGLLIAYLTDDETKVHILRGEFGPDTAATGHPDLYHFLTLTGIECKAIFATSLAGGTPTPVWGEDTDMAYALHGRGARDIADPDYPFSTDGGTLYQTTMTRDRHMLKNIRAVRLKAENMAAGNSWQIQTSFDDAAPVNIGAAVTANGYQIIRPVTGTPAVPQSDVSGYTIKPNAVQTAGAADASSNPPQLRGSLEVDYDERPDKIDEIAIPVWIGELDRTIETDITDLQTLSKPPQAEPITIQLPGETTDRYGMVARIERLQDIEKDGVQAADVILQLWSTA